MSDMIPATLTVGELEKAGMPSSAKTQLRSWYESIRDGDTSAGLAARAKLHVGAAIDGVRMGGESLVAGGILGTLAATLPNGLDYEKVPLDAAGGAICLMAGAALAHVHYGKDVQNLGATALGIFAFRKSFGVIAEMRRKEGHAVASLHGDYDHDYPNETNTSSDMGAEDPIIAAGRML